METWNIICAICAILEVITLIVTLTITLVSLSRSRKVERQKTVVDLYKEFIKNDDIYEAFHEIEFNPDEWFDANKFYKGGKDSLEKKIDRLFIYLNGVIYSHNIGILSDEDFELFKYKINSVFRSQSTIEYLKFLNAYSDVCVDSQSSFQHLINYGKESGYFDIN